MLIVRRRLVNNHNNVKMITNKVGSALAQKNLKPLPVVKGAYSVKELIIQIDGGHIPIKAKDKRSFEARSVIAYRREFTHKSCALSAQDNELASMKTYTLNALREQGKTHLTVLADGAFNCWSVILSLTPHLKKQ